MTNKDKEFWVTNIENEARLVEEAYGYNTVTFILQKYGVSNFESIKPSDFSTIFNELHTFATV